MGSKVCAYWDRSLDNLKQVYGFSENISKKDFLLKKI